MMNIGITSDSINIKAPFNGLVIPASNIGLKLFSSNFGAKPVIVISTKIIVITYRIKLVLLNDSIPFIKPYIITIDGTIYKIIITIFFHHNHSQKQKKNDTKECLKRHGTILYFS